MNDFKVLYVRTSGCKVRQVCELSCLCKSRDLSNSFAHDFLFIAHIHLFSCRSISSTLRSLIVRMREQHVHLQYHHDLRPLLRHNLQDIIVSLTERDLVFLRETNRLIINVVIIINIVMNGKIISCTFA